MNTENIIYFFAGAALPTIAFLLLGRKDMVIKQRPHNYVVHDLHLKQEDEEEEENDEEDEDESYLVAAQLESKIDPTTWGMKDAPYKVRSRAYIFIWILNLIM